MCSGEVFETADVSRLRVYYTTDNLAGGASQKDQLHLDSTMTQSGIDVTREFLDEGKFAIGKQFATNSKQVFIVHGHDDVVKYELARIIDREFHLESIILHEEPDKGRTIIEKLEGVSELPGFAFILLTPDDLGAELVPDEYLEKFNDPHMRPDQQKTRFEYRARQNVVFEMGFFIGFLGRDRVCCLYKEDVALPSDISGVLYKKFKNISEIKWDIRKELKAAGYDV
jgi:predicted nucleotide-binding protein